MHKQLANRETFTSYRRWSIFDDPRFRQRVQRPGRVKTAVMQRLPRVQADRRSLVRRQVDHARAALKGFSGLRSGNGKGGHTERKVRELLSRAKFNAGNRQLGSKMLRRQLRYMRNVNRRNLADR